LKRFAPLLVAGLLVAAPARLQAQEEQPPKTDEKKPDEKKPDEKKPNRFQDWQYPIERLKNQLKLSDEQYKKLEGFRDEESGRFRQEVRDLQKNEALDLSKMRDLFPKYLTEIQDKVRSVLDDDQKAKYEEIVKEETKRMKEGPRNGLTRDPEALKKRLMDQAEKELALNPAEKTAVLPLIQKVLDARAEARTSGDKRKEDFTNFVRKAVGQDETQKADMQKRLEEYRRAREADQEKIKEAEAALRDVLTIENEAKLVALGILD